MDIHSERPLQSLSSVMPRGSPRRHSDGEGVPAALRCHRETPVAGRGGCCGGSAQRLERQNLKVDWRCRSAQHLLHHKVPEFFFSLGAGLSELEGGLGGCKNSALGIVD